MPLPVSNHHSTNAEATRAISGVVTVMMTVTMMTVTAIVTKRTVTVITTKGVVTVMIAVVVVHDPYQPSRSPRPSFVNVSRLCEVKKNAMKK